MISSLISYVFATKIIYDFSAKNAMISTIMASYKFAANFLTISPPFTNDFATKIGWKGGRWWQALISGNLGHNF